MNGCALSTQQSTCWACSSDHISSDGNVFISLNNLSLLMNLYEITPTPVRALCIYWVKMLLKFCSQGVRYLRKAQGIDVGCPYCFHFWLLRVSLSICVAQLKRKPERDISHITRFLIAGRFHAACTSMPSFASSQAWEASDASWSALCSSLSTLASR